MDGDSEPAQEVGELTLLTRHLNLNVVGSDRVSSWKRLLPLSWGKWTNPVDESGFIQAAFYTWITRVVSLAHKGQLELKHIQDLISERDQCSALPDTLDPKTGKAWHDITLFALLFYNKKLLAITVVLYIFHHIIKSVSQSYVVQSLLNCVRDGDRCSARIGYSWMMALFLLELCNTMTLNLFFLNANRLGVRLRALYWRIVYRKLLNSSVSSQGLPGVNVVGLCGADAQRLYDLGLYGSMILSAPTVLISYTVLSVVFIDWPAASWLFAFVVLYPIQFALGRLSGKLRQRIATHSDARLKLVSETLTCIKTVKLCSWEDHVITKTVCSRKKETSYIFCCNFVFGLMFGLSQLIFILAPLVAISFMLGLGRTVSAANIFTIIIMTNSCLPSVRLFPTSVNSFMQALVSVKRLNVFLNTPDALPPWPVPKDDDVELKITSASFSWTEELRMLPITTKNFRLSQNGVERHNGCLSNINLVVTKGSKWGICGKVGSGKSTLLKAILGQLPIKHGSVEAVRSIGFMDQQPWMFDDTIRNNILFGQSFDEARYQRVCEACGLVQDFRSLPQHDLTQMGDNGINLSGGQKQRISLARLVYADYEVYLLDDPLSAVDVSLADHIFNNVVLGLLKGKTVVMVTSTAHFLNKLDRIVMMKFMTIDLEGQYKDNVESSEEFQQLLQLNSGSPIEVVIPPPCYDLPEYMEPGSTSPQFSFDRSLSDTVIKVTQEKTLNKVVPQALPEQLQAQTGSFCVETSDGVPCSHLKYTSDDPTAVVKEIRICWPRDHTVQMTGPSLPRPVSKGYILFVKACGGIILFIFCLIPFGLFTISRFSCELWIMHWIRRSSVAGNLTDQISPSRASYSYYGVVYIGMVLASFVVLIVQTMSFNTVFLRGGNRLFRKMLCNVVFSPMAFFEKWSTGEILTRFSKDMDDVDSALPMQLQSCIQNLFNLSMAIVSAVIYLPWISIGVVFLFLAYLGLAYFFQRALLVVKKFDNQCKAPLISHIETTRSGLATIQSAGRSLDSFKAFSKHLDRATASTFVYLCLNRWFASRVEVCVHMLVLMTAFLLVFLRENIDSVISGLVLSSVLRLSGGLQFMLREFMDSAARFDSVQRILKFTEDLDIEPTSGLSPTDWPSNGKIDFCDITLQYKQDAKPALSSINLTIQAGEKIGLVGRSGAGKSTLINLLHRIVQPTLGHVEIDGVDISKVKLTYLRPRLVTVPQDPTLFNGTLRYNLDPRGEKCDGELVKSLLDVGLGDLFSSFQKGLDFMIEDGGVNVSCGQRQLICLARALLSNCRVLLLDEATSAADPLTESIVKTLIHTVFSSCTVIVVAHRLTTVMSCDRVVVMCSGQVVEAGPPRVLMDDPQSKFRVMARTLQTH